MGFRTREPVAKLIDDLDAYQRSLDREGRCNVGDGIVTNLFGTARTVDEIITCTATDATHFAVVGSVSGALGTAAVGTPFTCAVCSFTITAGATAWAAPDTFSFVVTVPWKTIRTSAGLKYIVTAQPSNIYAALFQQAVALKERWEKWAERQKLQ